MKAHLSAVTLGVALLFIACNVEKPMRWQSTNQVEFDLLVVQMPEATAMPLIPELRDKKRSEKATQMVVKLVKENKATLIGWPVLATKSGQRAVVEQIDEFRYATEYDPPGRSIVTRAPAPPVAAPVDPALSRGPEDSSTEGTAKNPQLGDSPSSTAAGPVQAEEGIVETTNSVHEGVPHAFETRNVGVTMEVEPIIGPDGRTIDLNLVPQHVRFLGMRKAFVEREGGKKSIVVEQPEFLTNKVTTSIQVEDGDHTLLGVFKVNDPPGQVELFILHTIIKRMEVPVARGGSRSNSGYPFSPEGDAAIGP